MIIRLMPIWLKAQSLANHDKIFVINVATRKTPAGSTPASPANLGLGAEGYLPPLRLHLFPG